MGKGKTTGFLGQLLQIGDAITDEIGKFGDDILGILREELPEVAAIHRTVVEIRDGFVSEKRYNVVELRAMQGKTIVVAPQGSTNQHHIAIGDEIGTSGVFFGTWKGTTEYPAKPQDHRRVIVTMHGSEYTIVIAPCTSRPRPSAKSDK